MDSTPTPTLLQPQSLSIKASASKLPIKRKIPDSSTPSLSIPTPNSPPILIPKLKYTTVEYGGDDDDTAEHRPPPFKFHRIWTEPDEIRFLQGLLDCSSEGLSLPRDLSIFYTRFSSTMSQPYTKSQLSEKLRRLRKKFRVISTRLSKGLDKALLSPHDRSLYELSKQLWHPDYSLTSPFGGGSVNNKPNNKSNLVGVKVRFSPVLLSASASVSRETMIKNLDERSSLDCLGKEVDNDDNGFDGDVKLSEVDVEFEGGVGEEELAMPSYSGAGIGKVAARIVIDVFDQSLKEVRTTLVSQGFLYPDHGSCSSSSSKEGKVESFEKRWREQQVAELDVLARRVRLVLEDTLQRQ